MELTVERAPHHGVAAHKEGRLQDAERFYRAILKSQPRHPDANHNLGVLTESVNKAQAALPLFKTALEANLKTGQFWLSYIHALIKDQQFDNAKQVVEQAEKHGVYGHRLNDLEAQLHSLNNQKDANSLNPPQSQISDILENYQKGRFSDAEKLALAFTQNYPKRQFSWKVLGVVLGAEGRNSEAVYAKQTALALSPQDVQAQSNLSIVLQKLCRSKASEISYRQAITLKLTIPNPTG